MIKAIIPGFTQQSPSKNTPYSNNSRQTILKNSSCIKDTVSFGYCLLPERQPVIKKIIDSFNDFPTASLDDLSSEEGINAFKKVISKFITRIKNELPDGNKLREMFPKNEELGTTPRGILEVEQEMNSPVFTEIRKEMDDNNKNHQLIRKFLLDDNGTVVMSCSFLNKKTSEISSWIAAANNPSPSGNIWFYVEPNIL